jgi:AcrR family transcriptional regulator
MRRVAKRPAPQSSDAEDATRERIIEAAFAAFVERGYAATTTLDIASRSRVSKRELYRLIGAKPAILHAAVAQRAQRMAPPGSLPPASNRAELLGVLTTFGATLLAELSRPGVVAVYRLAIAEVRQSPELAREIDLVRGANLQALTVFIADAQGRELIGPGEPARLAQTFLDLQQGNLLMRRVLGLEPAPTPEETRRRARLAAETLLAAHPPAPGGGPDEDPLTP